MTVEPDELKEARSEFIEVIVIVAREKGYHQLDLTDMQMQRELLDSPILRTIARTMSWPMPNHGRLEWVTLEEARWRAGYPYPRDEPPLPQADLTFFGDDGHAWAGFEITPGRDEDWSPPKVIRPVDFERMTLKWRF